MNINQIIFLLKPERPTLEFEKKKILISIILNLQEDDEFIGFATLPDQVHRKAVKRGFEFSFMVVG